MPSDLPEVFDDDNPEWTDADFARARPASEFPELARAFPRVRGPQIGPVKKQVTLRLDRDVIDKFRATGKGWQARMNEVLKAARV